MTSSSAAATAAGDSERADAAGNQALPAPERRRYRSASSSSRSSARRNSGAGDPTSTLRWSLFAGDATERNTDCWATLKSSKRCQCLSSGCWPGTHLPGSCSPGSSFHLTQSVYNEARS